MQFNARIFSWCVLHSADHRFGRTSCIHQLPPKCPHAYQTTQYQTPEDGYIRSRRCQNIRFQKRCDVMAWIQLVCEAGVGNEHKKKPTLLSEWVLEGNGSFSPTFSAYQIPIPLLFTSLTFSEANIVILQGMMACSLVDKYPSFIGMSYCRLQGKKVNQPHYRPEVPRGFQEVKVRILRDNGPEWW